MWSYGREVGIASTAENPKMGIGRLCAIKGEERSAAV
jgi:hypothetical protein